MARATAALLLVLAACRAAMAADANAWKSQIMYFLLTDRFAQSPGTKPGSSCDLTGWNNGTWAGITANLDALKDMGMTSIWITPIPKQLEGRHFGETGYHGYWAGNWSQIEQRYGSAAELKALIATARKKGVMTMLDVVGNHVGPVGTNYTTIWPFNSTQHYHACIPGCDMWCNIPQSAYDSRPPNYTLITTCRLQNLPDLNQTSPFVKAQLLSWLNRTLQDFDFDGLRIDTVKHVEPSFWQDYTAAAKRFTIGEVLNGDIESMLRYTSGPRPASNSILNFPLFFALTDAFAQKGDLSKLAAERARHFSVLGREVVSTSGNFVDNHDFPRFSTITPDQRLLANALTWILLADGIPIIYYGTASAMKGGVAGGANRACLWEDPYNKTSMLYTTISRLSKFRTANQLWKQPETTLAATTNCYAYARGPDAVIVTTNAGSGLTTTCNVQLPKDSRLMEAGPSGVLDVLPLPGVRGSASSQNASRSTTSGQGSSQHDNGLVWYPNDRRLAVRLVDGAPRVLTTRRANLTGLATLEAGSGSSGDPLCIGSDVRCSSAAAQAAHAKKTNSGSVRGMPVHPIVASVAAAVAALAALLM